MLICIDYTVLNLDKMSAITLVKPNNKWVVQFLVDGVSYNFFDFDDYYLASYALSYIVKRITDAHKEKTFFTSIFYREIEDWVVKVHKGLVNEFE